MHIVERNPNPISSCHIGICFRKVSSPHQKAIHVTLDRYEIAICCDEAPGGTFCARVRIRNVSRSRPVSLALLLCCSSTSSTSSSVLDCSLSSRNAAIRSSGGAVRSLLRSRKRDLRRRWWVAASSDDSAFSPSPSTFRGGGRSEDALPSVA
jgi:hypothetical protein